MGFPLLFISWIRKCVDSAMISIKINGAQQGYFSAKSGLRQGDPISPALFVIAMEVFSRILMKATSSQDFNYHWRAKPVNLSHLIFADDLLFCKADNTSIGILMDAIGSFSRMSGLQPNNTKSNWFFANTSPDIVEATITISGF